jgi:hypothetical protein
VVEDQDETEMLLRGHRANGRTAVSNQRRDGSILKAIISLDYPLPA